MEHNKILIVEDNKSLAKLIAKRMESNVEMSVDVAHSFAEAKEFLKHSQDYFIALLDLNLPDAPNGEIVDFVIETGLPSIVLTASVDNATRDLFIHKDIVDYVYKGNIDDINYIFHMINRLKQNRQYKIIVVEDSMAIRNGLKKVLSSLQFQVLAAAHGEEAMNYLKENPDVKLIITDYRMPVKDGLEVLKEVRENHDKNSLGVIVITSPVEAINAAAFIKHGANDFIAKPFEKEELICRVHNTIEAMENIERIADFANKDFLTGVYNRRYFFSNIEEYMKKLESSPEPYALAMIDIDFFKKINDTYGHDSGDEAIKFLAKKLKDFTKGSDIVARFGGEEFCVVLKNIPQDEAVKFFVNLRVAISSSKIDLKTQSIGMTVSIGVAFNKTACDINEMIELADKALYDAKNLGRNRVEIAK